MRIFCSICKDIFIPYSEVHVTNCGHLYHGTCISTWTKHHRTCPQCRAKMSQPFRVYFDVEKDDDRDLNTLENEVETLSDKLREAEKQKNTLQDEYNNYKTLVDNMKECALSLTRKNDVLKSSVKALKEQIVKLTKQNEVVSVLENEVVVLKTKVSTLERIETVIKGSVEETNKMIESTPVTELAVRQLCTYVGVLKTQLHKLEEKNWNLVKQNREIASTFTEKVMKNASELVEIENLKEKNSNLENELSKLKKLLEEYGKEKHHKKEEEVLFLSEPAKIQRKKTIINIDEDLDDLIDTSGEICNPIKKDKTINHWEKLVCAGPSRNVGLSFLKSKSFGKVIGSSVDDLNLPSSSSVYDYDGFGGRKKIRLGNPTPVEEFEKIKKKKEKKFAAPFQHKKIIDYYQID